MDLQPKLKEATIATDALLVKVEADTVVAMAKKEVVEKDEKECKAQAAESQRGQY